MQEAISVTQIKKLIAQEIKTRLQQALEEYVERNELRVKELSLIERTIRVEEELRSLREMSEVKFEAMEKRFEAVDKRFEAVEKRFEAVDKRFEAVEKRFDLIDKRFESLQQEMNTRFEALQREMNTRFEALQREMNMRFEAVDKRFAALQWMIGILVGIPAIAIAISQIIKII